MKILVIGNHGNYLRPRDGADRRRRHLIQELLKDNDVISLESNRFAGFVSQNWCPERLKIAFFREYYIRGYPVFVPFLDINPSYLVNLWRIIRTNSVDVVQVSFPPGIIAVRIVSKALRRKISIVYDSHNVESELRSSTGTGFPWPVDKLFQYYAWVIEYLATRVSDLILTISEDDKDLFSQRYGVSAGKMVYVPFCATFKPISLDRRQDERARLGLLSDEVGVIFHGTWNYVPNQEAIKQILDVIAPGVLAMNAKVKFFIAGKDVPCCRRDNVEFLGFIESIEDLLSAMDIAIAPDGDIRRTGVRIKLVEYLCFGLPVITTRAGAKGLRIEDGKHAVILDRVDQNFVDKIIYYADNQTERNQLGVRAKEYAIEHLNPKTVGSRLYQAYLDMRLRTGSLTE
jgi:glycosyltransferase involved in cell wall biosynthesis